MGKGKIYKFKGKGLNEIIDYFKISPEKVWISEAIPSEPKEVFPSYYNEIIEKATLISTDTIINPLELGNFEINILSPTTEHIDNLIDNIPENTSVKSSFEWSHWKNDSSIVLSIVCLQNKQPFAHILMAGDIEERGWQSFLRDSSSNNILLSDLYKVSHHGSITGIIKDGFSNSFYKKPLFTIITNNDIGKNQEVTKPEITLEVLDEMIKSRVAKEKDDIPYGILEMDHDWWWDEDYKKNPKGIWKFPCNAYVFYLIPFTKRDSTLSVFIQSETWTLSPTSEELPENWPDVKHPVFSQSKVKKAIK